MQLREEKEEINLTQITDAQVWAKEWLKTIQKHPGIPYDEETMIAWFASAIMAGYDSGRRSEEKMWLDSGCKIERELTDEELSVIREN